MFPSFPFLSFLVRYLRHHMSDASYMRDWSMHRMLARFDLPYLRTRHVRFFINGVAKGLYAFMEAPDQDYVFQRSFPKYNKANFSLFKFKSMAIGGCAYSDAEIAAAPDSDNTTTYAFERGAHRQKIKTFPITTPNIGGLCMNEFMTNMARERVSVVSAWKRYGRDCGKTLIKTGLLNRDLGPKVNKLIKVV